MTELGGRAVRPDIFASDSEALEAVYQLETRAIAYIGNASVMTALRMETDHASGTPLRPDDPASLHRISAWLST